MVCGEQIQRTRADGEDRVGGDGVGVGHDGGMQGGGRGGGELDGGDERWGAERVYDGGELVRRGDGVELEGGQRGDDGGSERERDGGELREREVRREAWGGLGRGACVSRGRGEIGVCFREVDQGLVGGQPSASCVQPLSAYFFLFNY